MGGIPIRPLRVLADCIEITLSDGSLAYVDLEDRAIVEGRNWTAAKAGNTAYACRQDGPKYVRLHRLIIKAPDSVLVDHRDRDGRNCRRANLRCATRSQNKMNAVVHANSVSGLKGVGFHRKTGKWQAEIKAHGARYYLGLFDTPGNAAKAYDDAAQRLHREFACTNAALAA